MINSLKKCKQISLANEDSRLDDISSKWQEGDYESLAKLAESLFFEGIYDLKAIIYFSYSSFILEGAQSIPLILTTLNKILKENTSWIESDSKIKNHISAGLNLLIKKMYKRLNREASRKSLSSHMADKTLANRIISSLKPLQRTITINVSQEKITTSLKLFEQWLLNYETPDLRKIDGKDTKVGKYYQIGEQGYFACKISKEFKKLLDIMSNFENEAIRGNMEEATTLMEHISPFIENFDPIVFFPDVFDHYVHLKNEVQSKLGNK